MGLQNYVKFFIFARKKCIKTQILKDYSSFLAKNLPISINFRIFAYFFMEL